LAELPICRRLRRQDEIDVTRSRTLPTFIVIGAMKAGTTSLYHYLREHPQIFMPKAQELDFFAVETTWRRGIDWYAEQFAGAGGDEIARGEASTAYSKYPHYPNVPERIARAIPACQLIYVVRNPVDRIVSHYRHRVAVGAERDPLERAVRENPIYLDYSRYALQIDRYLNVFPQEQLLVVESERLRVDRAATMQRIYGFLGVRTDVLPQSLDNEFYRTEGRRTYPPVVWTIRRAVRRSVPSAKRAKEFVDSIGRRRSSRRSASAGGGSSASADPPAVPPSLTAFVHERLGEDLERLRELLGPDFTGWELQGADASSVDARTPGPLPSVGA